MARNRMITPEYWLDEDLAKLSAHARLLYIGLWNICDDNYATLPNRPEWIKAQIFPYESVNIPQLLGELSGNSKITLFLHEGKEYWFLKNFFKHQRVEKPSKPKYPEFSEAKTTNSRGVVGEQSDSPLAKDKISKVKSLRQTIEYLSNIPVEDTQELIMSFIITRQQIELKAKELINWHKIHGKKIKDFKALLTNAVIRDFKSRDDGFTTIKRKEEYG